MKSQQIRIELVTRPDPFQRRLLYTNVKPRFPEVGLFLETVMLEPGNKDRFIRISKVDGDQEARLAKEKDEKELQDLKGDYFSHVCHSTVVWTNDSLVFLPAAAGQVSLRHLLLLLLQETFTNFKDL